MAFIYILEGTSKWLKVRHFIAESIYIVEWYKMIHQLILINKDRFYSCMCKTGYVPVNNDFYYYYFQE